MINAGTPEIYVNILGTWVTGESHNIRYPVSCHVRLSKENSTKIIFLWSKCCLILQDLLSPLGWGMMSLSPQWLLWDYCLPKTWWRHQMETFSTLLALCAGNSTVNEFPAQRPVTRSFDVFFDLHLNKRLSKQWEAGDLGRYCAHYDVIVMGCQAISRHCDEKVWTRNIHIHSQHLKG